MTLLTKSIYEPREEKDGVRLLIMRIYPRGVKKDRFDRWVKELSPSVTLLKAYSRNEKSWDVFRTEFIAELRSNPSSLEALRSLRKESRKGNVTILCHEKSGTPCHRYIVAELVKNPKLIDG